jgi:hypothetical protein
MQVAKQAHRELHQSSQALIRVDLLADVSKAMDKSEPTAHLFLETDHGRNEVLVRRSGNVLHQSRVFGGC